MDQRHELLSVTSRGADVLIRVRGALDAAAVRRLCDLLEDLLARGGMVSDVVLDLGATTGCTTDALVDVASLMGAGMRLAPTSSCARGDRPRERARHVRASVV